MDLDAELTKIKRRLDVLEAGNQLASPEFKAQCDDLVADLRSLLTPIEGVVAELKARVDPMLADWENWKAEQRQPDELLKVPQAAPASTGG